MKPVSKPRVGVLAYRYGFYTYRQSIIDKVPGVAYVPVNDLFSLYRRIALKINQLVDRPIIPTFDLNNQFEDFDLNKVDLIHLMNGVSYGHTPWVVSFETIVPRFRWLLDHALRDQEREAIIPSKVRRALEALGSRQCRKLMAWSRNAMEIEKDVLGRFPSELATPILDKLTFLHPPQKIQVEHVRVPAADEKLRFMLVGAAFFRKGGRELFQVFEKLHGEGLPVQLVAVSSLRMEPYAAHETQADVDWAKQVIAARPEWLEYYQSLPNADVLALMKTAHVGLLPTWADTYGISVLEAQSNGLPVISTDVRALPEINNNRVGWLIKVPKNDLGEALYQTEEARAELSAAIRAGLQRIIRDIVQRPEVIAEKGEQALARIRAEHDPHNYAEALRQIYGFA